ncbi:nitroreductase [Planctobacterium marinum]|uniref:Nitroreductase n=1 Tax=Planctobacterium marinum TaxID=1631968 RepID=A0AA48KVE8_9ALTE|nr:nitroreductase [Planctobacterium marinum]
MLLTDIINQRRSIRSFSEKEVSDEVLNELLNLALESPSSSNSQPYKIAIAKGATAKAIAGDLQDKFWRSNAINKQPLPKKLFSALTSDAMPDSDFKPILGKYPGEFQKRRVETGMGLYKVLGIKREDKKARDEHMAKNFSFFDAPVALFFFVDPRMKHTALVDAGIFMQTLMLAATDKGLGTCAQGALGIWRSPLDKHFAIPKEYKLVCGMALGYPDDNEVNQYRPEKLSLSDLVIPGK